jgi:hypothetical protein
VSVSSCTLSRLDFDKMEAALGIVERLATDFAAAERACEGATGRGVNGADLVDWISQRLAEEGFALGEDDLVEDRKFPPRDAPADEDEDAPAPEDENSDRALALAAASDCALDLVAYDRKEDEELPLGRIEELVREDPGFVEELVDAFRASVLDNLDLSPDDAVYDPADDEDAAPGEVPAGRRSLAQARADASGEDEEEDAREGRTLGCEFLDQTSHEDGGAK